MKRYIRLLPLLLCLPLLFACGDGQDAATEASGNSFTMTATITAIGDRIEVNVTEGPYGAEGPYWVIAGDKTAYFDESGNKIKRGALAVGDTVEITYGGQVMMSYPPQVVASAIRKK